MVILVSAYAQDSTRRVIGLRFYSLGMLTTAQPLTITPRGMAGTVASGWKRRAWQDFRAETPNDFSPDLEALCRLQIMMGPPTSSGLSADGKLRC